MNLYGDTSYIPTGSDLIRGKRGTLESLYGGEIPAYEPSQPAPIEDVTGAGSQVTPEPSGQKVGAADGFLSKLLVNLNTEDTPEEKALRAENMAKGNKTVMPANERAQRLGTANTYLADLSKQMQNQNNAYDNENRNRIASAADQGPAMLAMIQSIGKRNDENRFRSGGLSAMAGI